VCFAHGYPFSLPPLQQDFFQPAVHGDNFAYFFEFLKWRVKLRIARAFNISPGGREVVVEPSRTTNFSLDFKFISDILLSKLAIA